MSPAEDDEYVVVDVVVVPSRNADSLGGSGDDAIDEDEYDYCDDIGYGDATHDYIDQPLSFEEVSDHLCSSSAANFSFGEEAEQLLLEIDESSASSSFLRGVTESEEIPATRISFSRSEYVEGASEYVGVLQEEKNASSSKDKPKQPEVVSDAASPTSSLDVEKQRKQHQQPSQQGGRTKSSRPTNKKRRKQMKLAKKAAAAAAAAASFSQLSLSHHHSISGPSSRATRKKPTAAIAAHNVTRAAPSKNKKQIAPVGSSIAVACATQSLAEYRMELQKHHRNASGATKLVR